MLKDGSILITFLHPAAHGNHDMVRVIAFGAAVAASGAILTHLMCRAMNRNLLRIFVPDSRQPKIVVQGQTEPAAAGLPNPPIASADSRCAGDQRLEKALAVLADAQKIIIVPGYGMALARAQFKVAALAAMLAKRGAAVQFAIHPVAGRMPGHMNVILAEAEVDYENLLEMGTPNPLYHNPKSILLLGDAQKTADDLISALEASEF